MKKYYKLFGIVIILFLFGFVCYNTYVVKINIVYTNDLHGRISILPKIGFYIKNLRHKNLIILDAGDFIQGTPESDFFFGRSMVDGFNKIGYTAVTLGNHEFDFGEQNIYGLKSSAKFDFLGSNIFSYDGSIKPYITNFIIRNYDGVKIGIFGLITRQTKYIVVPENIKNVEILDEILVAKKVVDELKYNTVDIIICVSHIGYSEQHNPDFVDDVLLAEEIPKINIIIGGHTHKTYCKKVNKTIVVQSGAYGSKVGHLKLYVFKPNKTILFFKNKFVETKKLNEDTEIKNYLSKYIDEVNKIFDTEVCRLEVDLPHYRDKESPLGCFICDIISELTSCDFVVTNSGGIRSSLNKGMVRYRDLYNILPFDNTVVKVKISGKDIKEIFEHSVSGKYGILQVSKNLKVVYDMTKPIGQRVKELYVKNEPVHEYSVYRVVTNSFLASGGEEYHWFSKSIHEDTKIKLRDMIKKYLENKKVIKETPSQGRIVFLTN